MNITVLDSGKEKCGVINRGGGWYVGPTSRRSLRRSEVLAEARAHRLQAGFSRLERAWGVKITHA